MSKPRKAQAPRPARPRGMNPLTWDRASTVPDKRKQASKRACRGRVTDR